MGGTFVRPSGRKPDELRPVTITRGYLRYPEGSALIQMGETRVLCTASIEEKVPPHAKEQGIGWITAEYAMLPRSTQTRTPRDAVRGRIGGRTHEIQRLIGRALRAVVDLSRLGERTIWIDCDVLQADGGTRTAAITGAFVALVEALRKAHQAGQLETIPVRDYLAAVSVGIYQGTPVLDLDYEEDSVAEVDLNLVMTGRGRMVEIQGTAEGAPFTRSDLDRLLQLGKKGIQELVQIQKGILGTLA